MEICFSPKKPHKYQNPLAIPGHLYKREAVPHEIYLMYSHSYTEVNRLINVKTGCMAHPKHTFPPNQEWVDCTDEFCLKQSDEA